MLENVNEYAKSLGYEVSIRHGLVMITDGPIVDVSPSEVSTENLILAYAQEPIDEYKYVCYNTDVWEYTNTIAILSNVITDYYKFKEE